MRSLCLAWQPCWYVYYVSTVTLPGQVAPLLSTCQSNQGASHGQATGRTSRAVHPETVDCIWNKGWYTFQSCCFQHMCTTCKMRSNRAILAEPCQKVFVQGSSDQFPKDWLWRELPPFYHVQKCTWQFQCVPWWFNKMLLFSLASIILDSFASMAQHTTITWVVRIRASEMTWECARFPPVFEICKLSGELK